MTKGGSESVIGETGVILGRAPIFPTAIKQKTAGNTWNWGRGAKSRAVPSDTEGGASAANQLIKATEEMSVTICI